MSTSNDILKPHAATMQASAFPTIGIAQIMRLLRRNMWRMVIGALLGLLVGWSYLHFVKPVFSATSVMQIDPRKVRAVQEAYAFASNNSSPSDIDLSTQIEIFKSDRLAVLVARKLELHHDNSALIAPQIPAGNVVVDLKSVPGLEQSAIKDTSFAIKSEQDRQQIIEALKDGVSVRRVPRTQVLEISFTTHDAKQAALIADAYADAYVDDQLETERAAAKRASVWLQEQLGTLKNTVQSTEQAVQQYKSRHNMLAANGRLIDEQKLGDVLTNLQQLRAETGKIDARYTKLKEIINRKQTDVLLTDTFSNPQLLQMRGQYLNLVKSETHLAKLLGNQHQAVLRIRSEKDEYSNLMLAEFKRLISGFAGELEVAKLRELTLANEFEQLAGKTGVSAVAQIELRELERSSDIYKSFYAVILQRNLEALQQQSFSDRSARIITNARIPTMRSGFSSKRIFALSLLLGAMAGGVLGLMRELLDKTFRTRKQVRDDLGVRHAWIIPRVVLSKAEVDKFVGNNAGSLDHKSAQARLNAARIRPNGHLTEVLLDMKSRLDLIEAEVRPRIIGIASVVAGAGATTIAANLATVLASTTTKVALVDADSKSATLTHLWFGKVDQKLLTDVSGSSVQDLAIPGTADTPSFVPAFRTGNDAPPIASSPIMRQLLSKLRPQYDYVVVDLPPITRHAGAINLVHELDAIILVVEWARDDRAMVAELMRAEPELSAKCLGVALNKTDLNRLATYEPAAAFVYH